MKSHISERFRKAFETLPLQVRQKAKEAYQRFRANPHHPSLQFKQIHPTKPIYSVRISIDYRAIGVRDDDEIVWFWIGSHTDYDQLVRRL